MDRKLMAFLEEWLVSVNRRPLVIRGARQVGKTWLIRRLAEKQNRQLIEMNFEKKPQLAALFDSNDPSQILLLVGAFFNTTIDPANSLLFLDEIQAAPELFAKLRWFAEDFPELPVIAAGSLLEFLLEKHSFSMPVGRIGYLHLEPLSFEEFLEANGKNTLVSYLQSYEWDSEIPSVIHEQLMDHFKEYLVIGGMPAAVSSWISKRSLQEVSQVQHDLIATYRDDMSKYRGRIEIERLEEVISAIPKLLGKKFVYTSVNPSIQIPTIKHSLDLLCKARICHRIRGSFSNGVPLLAEVNDKYLKMIFLDVGLCLTALGLSLNDVFLAKDLQFINQGGVAEQVVGQLLRTIDPPYIEPSLFYWHREEKGSSAEIDYVMQHGNLVIPIEVKSGNTGGLKSLHVFMGLKKYAMAVRINSDLPSQTEISMKDHSYRLLSLPFYLLGQLHRLISHQQKI